MVESHGSITLATLRDVNLDKRCVALPRYIVYVYILTIIKIVIRFLVLWFYFRFYLFLS